MPAESPDGSPDDRELVAALIGRPPQGSFEVVVRDAHGGPVVLRNEPFLDDGTPMPTRYYLVGTELVRATSRIEAAGGVRQAEAEIAAKDIAATHAAYAAERDATIDEHHSGPRPSGGVGGTREGVKCLHAHLAHLLAGGTDPVGDWTVARLRDDGVDLDGLVMQQRMSDTSTADVQAPAPAPAPILNADVGGLTVHIEDDRVTVTMTGGGSWTFPLGATTLLANELERADPPRPAQLTNALGLVHDHFDDIIVEAPSVLATPSVVLTGHHAESLARTEIGREAIAERTPLMRADADEIFRTVVAEPIDERRHNPGLDEKHVGTIVSTLCIVLSIMRRLGLDQVEVFAPGEPAEPEKTRER